jgi:hypothetical protein
MFKLPFCLLSRILFHLNASYPLSLTINDLHSKIFTPAVLDHIHPHVNSLVARNRIYNILSNRNYNHLFTRFIVSAKPKLIAFSLSLQGLAEAKNKTQSLLSSGNTQNLQQPVRHGTINPW